MANEIEALAGSWKLVSFFTEDVATQLLGDATLDGARLSLATLSQASLTDATLSGAHLVGTDFSEAGLVRANLSGVNLHQANLSDAKVTGIKWDRKRKIARRA